MMSAREWAVTERSWAVVAGDGHPTYWIELDPGLHLITGRTTVAIDKDEQISAWRLMKYVSLMKPEEEITEGDYRIYDGKLYRATEDQTTPATLSADTVKDGWELVLTKSTTLAPPNERRV